MATQNRLTLEMLLENQAQWKTEQRLKRERMQTERDQWAAEHAECSEPTERRIVGPRPNIYTMVDPVRYCGGAKELVQCLDAL
jgi:hypothetical protein